MTGAAPRAKRRASSIVSGATRRNRRVEWCMRRCRSHNPRTGTRIDYHGRIRYYS